MFDIRCHWLSKGDEEFDDDVDELHVFVVNGVVFVIVGKLFGVDAACGTEAGGAVKSN